MWTLALLSVSIIRRCFSSAFSKILTSLYFVVYEQASPFISIFFKKSAHSYCKYGIKSWGLLWLLCISLVVQSSHKADLAGSWRIPISKGILGLYRTATAVVCLSLPGSGGRCYPWLTDWPPGAACRHLKQLEQF